MFWIIPSSENGNSGLSVRVCGSNPLTVSELDDINLWWHPRSVWDGLVLMLKTAGREESKQKIMKEVWQRLTMKSSLPLRPMS